jgi:MoxR-like ATPase
MSDELSSATGPRVLSTGAFAPPGALPASAPSTPGTAPSTTALSNADVAWFAETFVRLITNVTQRIQGKADQVSSALICLISEGHLLLEDVPGVGKTSLARALAESISGSWKRVQFTPDLLPSDVTGSLIYRQNSGEFEFRKGPVFANIVIGDEINRASPKTQSALLEVMEERQVTVDGEPRSVPRPFVVIATQNPIEMDGGTYSLPEAQLDRFLLKMTMGYPDAAAEASIVTSRHGGAPGPLSPVVSVEDAQRMIQLSASVRTDPQIVNYVVSVVQSTRQTADVRLGASPRGTIGLLRAAQTLAIAEGRAYVIADDVKRLAVPVLAHRLVVAPEAQLRGITAERVIVDLLNRVAVPGGIIA